MTQPQNAGPADDCTFCNLVQGAAEVSMCYEDADSIAFMDIQPVNPGHVLVVPRAHYESLLDVPEEVGAHLFRVTMQLAAAVRRVTGCDDMNIVVNSGAAAGQDEPHYHVHIIPRRKDDGFDIPLPFDGSSMPNRQQLDAFAARILSEMHDPVKSHAGSGAPRHASAPEHAEPRGAGKATRNGRAAAVPAGGEVPAIAEGAHGELRRPETEM